MLVQSMVLARFTLYNLERLFWERFEKCVVSVYLSVHRKAYARKAISAIPESLSGAK